MFRLYHYIMGLFFLILTFSLVYPNAYASLAIRNNTHKRQETNCNYDPNDIRTFTLDAIKNYDSTLDYHWDEESKVVYFMHENDTVLLQIGGCDVFSYNIAYKTANTANFYEEDSVTEKVTWLTRNFFSSGFDTKFWEAIRDGRYFLDSANSDSLNKIYLLDNIDTTIQSNQVFRGFGVRKLANGAEIWASGYFD